MSKIHITHETTKGYGEEVTTLCLKQIEPVHQTIERKTANIPAWIDEADLDDDDYHQHSPRYDPENKVSSNNFSYKKGHLCKNCFNKAQENPTPNEVIYVAIERYTEALNDSKEAIMRKFKTLKEYFEKDSAGDISNVSRMLEYFADRTTDIEHDISLISEYEDKVQLLEDLQERWANQYSLY